MELVFHQRAFPRDTQPQPVWDADGTWTSQYWFSRIGLMWVDSLLARDIEVAWASNWLEYANVYFAPSLGLPRLPVAVTREDWAALAAGDMTARDLARPFDGRPLLVVTDALSQRSRLHLDALRPPDRALTGLQFIRWTASITKADIAAMDRWLEFAATPEGHLQPRRQRRQEIHRARARRRNRAKDTDATPSQGVSPPFAVRLSDPLACIGSTAHRPFPSRSRFEARRVRIATRIARRLIADVDAAGVGRGARLSPHDDARLVAALRELVNAITALSPGPDRATLTAEEEAFAIAGGVPASAFAEQGRRDAQDWIVWSALRADGERRTLDALLHHAIDEIVPGLRDAIGAFPETCSDLERFTVLTTPDETLAGLSPIQWWLLGRDATTVTTHIDDLGRLS